MKPYEFMRFYHPKLGRFVYKPGDLIMKKLAKARATPTMKTTTPKKEESTDTILNRLISGNGLKRRRKIM